MEVTLHGTKTHGSREGTCVTKRRGTSPYVENGRFVPDSLASISCAIQVAPFAICRDLPTELHFLVGQWLVLN